MTSGEDGLPGGWAWSTIGEILGGSVFTDGDWVESKDQDPEGPVRLVQLADVGEGEFRDRSDRWLNELTAKRLNCTYLRMGDVLFARMPDPIGRACLVPDLRYAAVTVVDVCVIRPDAEAVLPAWLMWAVNSPEFRDCVVALESGTTRKRISRKNLATVAIPVPPRAEQERIVAAIEEHRSRLDAAESAIASARRRLEAFERAAVSSLFDREDWAWTTLGEIADLKGGVTKDAKRQADPSFVEVPYLRVANVQRGFLDLSEVTNIRVATAKAEQLALQPGDILFNEGGDRDKLGRGAVWEGQIEGCIHQNHVFRARVTSPDFDPHFVSMHGNTWGQQWFEKHGKQTTNLASINLSTLKAFPVPAPTVDEQRTVMAELGSLLAGETRLTAEVDRAAAHASALRRSILATAFSGRLVAQDPSDEPAEVLLARISAGRFSSSSKSSARAKSSTRVKEASS